MDNILCVNLMYDIVRVGWCAVVVAVLSLCAMVVTYLFGVWFGNVEKNNLLFDEGYNGDNYS